MERNSLSKFIVLGRERLCWYSFSPECVHARTVVHVDDHLVLLINRLSHLLPCALIDTALDANLPLRRPQQVLASR